MNIRHFRWAVGLALVTVSVGCLLGPGPGERPDPNKTVWLENEYDKPVAVEVELVREATNETVHRGRHEVPAGTTQTLTSTSEGDPEGVERFTFRLHALNQTATVSVQTSECYGGASALVRDDGTLTATYVIC